MNFAELETYVRYFMMPSHTVALSGNHGLGKTSFATHEAVKILAEINNVPVSEFGLIVKRPSQLDPSDFIGTQHRVGGHTYCAPPDWLPMCTEAKERVRKVLASIGEEYHPIDTPKYGLLVFDEYVRGDEKIQQVLMEMLNDHSSNGVKIPNTWYVMCSDNGNLNLYNGTERDEAQKSRVVKIDFTPTAEEFFIYMERAIKEQQVHPAIVSYLKKFPEHLEGMNKDIEANMTKEDQSPCRRSWERFGEELQQSSIRGFDTVTLCSTNGKAENMLTFVACAHVGPGINRSFVEYCKTEFRLLSVHEILENWNPKIEERLLLLSESNKVAVTSLGNAIISELVNNYKEGTELPEEVQFNISKFLKHSPRESVTNFWKEWCKKDMKQADRWYSWSLFRKGLVLKAMTSNGNKVYESWVEDIKTRFESSKNSKKEVLSFDEDIPIPSCLIKNSHTSI